MSNLAALKREIELAQKTLFFKETWDMSNLEYRIIHCLCERLIHISQQKDRRC